MSTNVDLNALRERVLANQSAGNARPVEPSKSVIVSKEGKIRLGDQPTNSAGPETIVPQETFAGALQNDREIARRYMPDNTREITTEEGVTGFVYSITTELRDEFTLFAFFDGSNYQVKVVWSELEKRFKSLCEVHLYSNGVIDFGNNDWNGAFSLRDAYAKSVLWANGLSIFMRIGRFPFTIS
jgi:hypothetical protein